MNFIAFITLLLITFDVATSFSANITSWRHRRRQKRFLIYENGGVLKMVTGIAFPVDFQEKNAWRQLVWLMNYHFQFPEPTTPIYWWQLFGSSRDLKGSLKQPPIEEPKLDMPQQILYEFAEEFMRQRGQHGRACLQRLICENAQVHEHNGLYAQLLHRLLTPHSSLAVRYLNAFSMGRHGINCRSAFPKATYCELDQYVHVHERGLRQSYV